jgi:hypothetical protein
MEGMRRRGFAPLVYAFSAFSGGAGRNIPPAGATGAAAELPRPPVASND